jgi:hypothetical protein
MKNIFLLPTDKPSRIYLVKSNNRLGITSNNPEFTENFGSGTQNQHIYITSYEEIKVGDWYYLPRTNSVHKCIEDPTELNLEIRLGVAKIILTTDSSLIVDGIQPIDDDFLKWFVNNPGCEVVLVRDKPKVKAVVKGLGIKSFENGYKIIIPKEEPMKQKQIMSFGEYIERSDKLLNRNREKTFEEKLDKIVSKEPSKFWAESDERTRIREERKQHLIEIMEGDEELGLYDEPKQDETEHLLSTQANKERLLEDVKQERMYSEEDMKSFGDWCRNGLLNSEYGIEKIQEHLEQWKQLKNNKPPL